jgi:hypothetical protein
MGRIPVTAGLLALSLVALITVGRTGGITGAQDATPAADGDGIVGSWVVTVQVDGGPTFPNYATFMPGGVLMNTADDGASGHGAWEITGDGTYATTFVHPIFDGNAVLEGESVVRSTLTLDPDGNGFTGPFLTEQIDLAGDVVVSFTGTVDARRIQVEPLPAGTPSP